MFKRTATASSAISDVRRTTIRSMSSAASLSRSVYSLYCLAPFCRLRFAATYIATRLFKDGRGNLNWLGKMAKRIRRN